MSKSLKIKTSCSDDFLYEHLISLLGEIKLVQGGNELAYTLRNHRGIKNYLMAKQVLKIQHIEDEYFLDDNSLNDISISEYNQS